MKKDSEECVICGGNAVSKAHDIKVKYKDNFVSYTSLYLQCDDCGETYVPASLVKENNKRLAEAKRKHDGLLSAEQIAKIRKKAGLTQKTASQLFGGGANAFSKYERGEVIQSEVMDNLLRFIDSDELIKDLYIRLKDSQTSEKSRH